MGGKKKGEREGKVEEGGGEKEGEGGGEKEGEGGRKEERMRKDGREGGRGGREEGREGGEGGREEWWSKRDKSNGGST